MFLVKLFNLIQGYVTIIIEGVFPERFLNICARRGIYLWDVKRTGKLSLSANASVRGFRLMRPIAKKARCTVRIKKKRGIPFYIYKHRRRKAFAVGAGLFVLLLFVMTRFIWVIDVTGNDILSTETVLENLERAGLKTGMLSGKIDTEYIRDKMMISLEELSWIGINIKGTTAHIEIKEREQKPDLFPKDEPCSIYALTDGVIQSIDAQNGQRLVAAGDVVKKGQLLISGALDSKTGEGVRYVHADGEVMARTWREITVPIPGYAEEKVRTGRSKSKHMVKIFSFYIKFFTNDRISYTNYDRISYVKKLSIGKDMVLPFSFHYDNYYEVEIIRRETDRNEALDIARSEAKNRVKDILVVSSVEEESQDTLKITYECLENIAQKKAILKGETNDNGENT
ncbi:MAG: putative stage IV sporulation protein YqfD [Firmicutes bacterium ADurb.Bin193]|nr:MAG: putative stage IV sporulation protein YqfD [Firmicutes bacterium ADurb.Bin193]